jgi:branched-chain amino acid transport system substrate-binding protein
MKTLGSLLLAVSMLAAAASASAQSPAPIKIGALADLTGPFAALGRDIVDGGQLYLDEVKGEMAGRKVQLVVEDTATRVDVSLTKTRKLVESDRVNALVGVVLSASAIAIKDYVTEKKTPFIISGFAVAEALTMEKVSPYVFRITYGPNTLPRESARWIYKNLKARRATVIASDTIGIIELVMGFARAFEEAGGKVVQEIYPPLGTADYGPYLASIRQDVDIVVEGMAGADAVRLVKQYQEFGLKGKIPLVDPSMFIDLTTLPAMGEAAVGAHFSWGYVYTLDTPRNRRFAQAFQARFGRAPGGPAAFTYDAMAVIHAALNAIGGKIEDTPRFLEALRKVDLELPRGRVRFDRYQHVVTDVHIGRIQKVDGRIEPVVLESVRDVDQFGGMDPNEYIKRPRLHTLKGSFAR